MSVFRNVSASPDDPVETWPTEAVQAALERGGLKLWHRLAVAIAADPWGPVARSVEEVLSHSRPYGISETMQAVLAAARAAAARGERQEVAREVAGIVRRSGLTKEQFASRIGTSAPRLSTYLSGQVVPSAALMVRIRRVGGAVGSFVG